MSVHVSSLVWKLPIDHAYKIVLLKLADHAKDDGSDVYPSQGRVAKECGLSDRTVRRYVVRALKDGLLNEMPSAGNRPNRYHFNMVSLLEVSNRISVAEAVSRTEGPGGQSVQVDRLSASGRTECPPSRTDSPPINKKHQLTTRQPSKGAKFLKPSAADCAAYAETVHLPHSEAEKFRDYWESQGWRRKSGPMKDWKASMRLWRATWAEAQTNAKPAAPKLPKLGEAS